MFQNPDSQPWTFDLQTRYTGNVVLKLDVV